MKILLIEDDKILSSSMCLFLKDQSFDILEASDGYDALNKIESFKPDIIISDIMMPNMNGYEFLSFIKSQSYYSKIPVIFLTAKGMTADRIKGYELGCTFYISKPFHPDELLSMIKNIEKRLIHTDKPFIKENKNKFVLSKKVVENFQKHMALTMREKSILEFVIDGYMNQEIANKLNISKRNVEKYVSRLLIKSKTRNRTELVKYVIDNS